MAKAVSILFLFSSHKPAMLPENALFSPHAPWPAMQINAAPETKSTKSSYWIQKQESESFGLIHSPECKKSPVYEERKRIKKMSERVLGFRWRILAALLYSVYTWFPLNTTSRLVGRLARIQIPRFLRVPAFRIFAWIFCARIEEAEFHDNLCHYTSISHFFRRRLLPGVRPVDHLACLTSPADGKIVSCGKVEEGHLEQVKGLAYTLQALLGPNTWSSNKSSLYKKPTCYTSLPTQNPKTASRSLSSSISETTGIENKVNSRVSVSYPLSYLKSNCFCSGKQSESQSSLYHCAIYLSPGDYHCFHSPADWTISVRRHFPGRLFSVCSLVTSWLHGVFCINERAIYKGEWNYGFFAFVAVGATNVGSIHVFNDRDLVTNRPSYLRYLFSESRHIPVNPDNVTVGDDGDVQVPIITKMDGYEDLHFAEQIKSTKGELFGEFNFGSTIVLIFEAPSNEFDFLVNVGDRIKVGRPLGHVRIS